ncbi:MAG: acetolactate synthase small subunit [Dehalococcoidia bacterium]|jgi:acetolactate synthase-1/3 small subunit|nr:acetolactate synthase small subunit [Dehalococcoidia bacterium]
MKTDLTGPLQTIAALVEDRPGVLTRVASLFRRRGYNIESLAVGSTDEIGVSRMTIVVEGTPLIGDQVAKQLDKLIDVITAEVLEDGESVGRELALIKVMTKPEQRREILDIVEIFRASVVDLSAASVIIQITAANETIEALTDNLRPYGILELVRTGGIALVRGEGTTQMPHFEDEELRRFHQESGRIPSGDLPHLSD